MSFVKNWNMERRLRESQAIVPQLDVPQKFHVGQNLEGLGGFDGELAEVGPHLDVDVGRWFYEQTWEAEKPRDSGCPISRDDLFEGSDIFGKLVD
jgi:hypothetical protein